MVDSGTPVGIRTSDWEALLKIVITHKELC
jgi:hypothetical protein